MKARLLVAEDDPNIRNGVVDILEAEGYEVAPARDGKEALSRWEEGGVDLVLLDVMMPGVNGFDVCRTIRQSNKRVPILMLTAKGEEIDKVLGLELGADDYMTKPFGLRELLARVHALLRRSAVPAEEIPTPESEFTFGEATVHPREMRCEKAGVRMDLSARELKLLELFRQHPEEVLTRDTLLNHGWGITYYGTTRTLDQHIVQLRKKVEADPSDPQTILTVHGTGYRYHPSNPGSK